MSTVTYHVVEHDGGWAYKLGETLSETFVSHDLAIAGARRAAAEQQIGGQSAEIRFQDRQGDWHSEHADGGDRPQAEVVDDTV